MGLKFTATGVASALGGDELCGMAGFPFTATVMAPKPGAVPAKSICHREEGTHAVDTTIWQSRFDYELEVLDAFVLCVDAKPALAN